VLDLGRPAGCTGLILAFHRLIEVAPRAAAAHCAPAAALTLPGPGLISDSKARP